MKLNRRGAALVAAAASALLLTACGSNPGASGGAPSGGQAAPAGNCTGKATVTGEGSSAQNNAMAVFKRWKFKPGSIKQLDVPVTFQRDAAILLKNAGSQ